MLTGECFAGEDAEVLAEAIHVDENGDPTGEDEDTIQDLAVWVKQYKQTETQATGATAVWNSNMGQYLITIPAAYVPASGIFDICVKGSDIWDILIRLQVNTADSVLSSLSTSTELGNVGANVVAIRAITDLLTLAAINAEVDTAISDAALATASGLSAVGSNVDLIKAKTDLLTLAAIKTQATGALTDFDTATPIMKTSELATITGGGTATLDSLETDISEISITGTSAVKVVHPDYYSFDASEKTITLSSPYNTVTVEQVLRIKDLTTNYIIYDCEDSKYDDIPVSIVDGVLTYTAPARDAADTDILQITVNMV